jgi:hypothetical protein
MATTIRMTKRIRAAMIQPLKPPLSHRDERQAGHQEEPVGGVRNPVIEELDPAEGEGEVL